MPFAGICLQHSHSARPCGPRRLACRISPLGKPIHCVNYLFYEEFTRSPNRGGLLLPPSRLPRPPPVRGSPRLFRRRYLFPTGRRTIRLFSRLLSCSLPPLPPLPA